MAALAAGVLSGAPSTAWSLATGHDVLAATRAAGTLLPGRRRRGGILAGLVAHAALTAFWTAVLSAVVRPGSRWRGAGQGAVAGLAIAAVDLGVVGRWYPAVRALPSAPQVADHVAFGVVAGAILGGGAPWQAASP